MSATKKPKPGHHYYLKSDFRQPVIVYIRPVTHRKLKMLAVRSGKTLQELLREAIERYMK
jgi:predicted DNA-binding protein